MSSRIVLVLAREMVCLISKKWSLFAQAHLQYRKFTWIQGKRIDKDGNHVKKRSAKSHASIDYDL